MEQITEAGELVRQGDALLAEGQALEGAARYAWALQLDANVIVGHLGLAKANLALGSFGTVYLACRQVQVLAPESDEAVLARAILFVVERRYDAARSELDRYAQLAPADAYAHALRGYCLRQIGQTYDAQLAEAKARRLSSGKEFGSLFPRVLPLSTTALPMMQPLWATPALPVTPPTPMAPPAPPGEAIVGSGSIRTAAVAADPLHARRVALLVRLQARAIPIVTYSLIGINVLVYLACAAMAGGNLASPTPISFTSTTADLGTLGPLYVLGAQSNVLMRSDPTQWYRVITALFLHANIFHLGMNMLSLYFVGMWTERLFGRWRFLAIYLVSGLLAGMAQFAFGAPDTLTLGAAGAIFGVFGAYGAFILANRKVFRGGGISLLLQWMFWLLLNVALVYLIPSFTLYPQVGGLVAGVILGAILVPRLPKARPMQGEH